MGDHYGRKAKLFEKIDPMIINGDPVIEIEYEATKFGFSRSIVSKRIDFLYELNQKRKADADKLFKEREAAKSQDKKEDGKKPE